MLSNDIFWKVLILSWVVTPIGMILVGIVFESRLVPLWRSQSKAFIPGDLGLGVVLAVGWYLYPQIPPGSFLGSAIVPMIGFFIGIVTCVVMRTWLDGENHYTTEQLRCPTKRYHDYVLYIGYLAALITICIPAILFGTSWGGDNLFVKLLALIALGVWGVGMIFDGFTGSMRDTEKMHPSQYQPIWKTRKLRFS